MSRWNIRDRFLTIIRRSRRAFDLIDPKWRRVLVKSLQLLGIGIAGAFLVIFGAGILILNQKPDLSVWHTADLDSEFSRNDNVTNFDGYLKKEEELFQQLEKEVYSQIRLEERTSLNRYHRESLSNPSRWPTNWNRTFLWDAPTSESGPKGAVLLLHGLSDSPYSLRTLGEAIRTEGFHVLGLRVPGHGTAPSSLAQTRWQDMAAAVELAVLHLSSISEGKPIHIIGYSNGGALALHYALTTLENKNLPKIERLILISPEIGITPAAALAIWQKRIGKVFGLKKLGWNAVSLEYDPFKYNSFPVNAGDLAHKLTKANRAKMLRLQPTGALDEFPRVLAFQSVVDATVTAKSLVTDLFLLLPERDHELVIFGLNRMTDLDPLFSTDHREQLNHLAILRDEPTRNYRLSLVAGVEDGNREVLLRSWEPRETEHSEKALGLHWPPGIFSLSHVALPFPETDPLYGGENAGESPGIQLGNLAMRGEKGTLRITPQDMLRLRWNPFYSFLEEKTILHLNQNQP